MKAYKNYYKKNEIYISNTNILNIKIYKLYYKYILYLAKYFITSINFKIRIL